MPKDYFIENYSKNFNGVPGQRKLIILMDGTWNDETGLGADGLVTNIVHLKRILKQDSEKQVVRYFRGVGNDNEYGLFSKVYNGVKGGDEQRIRDSAYARIVKEYLPGDKIFIYGFSRGAASARLLAMDLNKKGIPRSMKAYFLPKENKETKVIEQRFVKYESTGEKHNVDVEFVGVWDTVSAFGIFNNFLRTIIRKKKDLFSDNHISSNIKRAVHLVGIDETRNPFVPSLMNKKTEEGKEVVHEVWFPGVHSDLGGSYPEDEIAKVTLHYMLKKTDEWIEEQGLEPLLTDEKAIHEYSTDSVEKAFFHFHGKGFGESLRKIGVQVNGDLLSAKDEKPKIHKLYRELCDLPQSYSVVEVKKNDKKDIKYIPFQYMPFNVKVLGGNYEAVD